MPRHKQIRVSIKDLSCGDKLKSELARMKSLAGFDLDHAEIVVKKRPAPFIKDVDRIIDNLIRYQANNKHLIEMFGDEQMINKKNLARMMKITRPTLDRWIENGFIEKGKSKQVDAEIYQIDEVVKQLQRYKNKG